MTTLSIVFVWPQPLSVELRFSLRFCRCLCLFVLFILYIFISWIQSSKPCWVHIRSTAAGGTECTNVALRVSLLTMKLQSYTATAQIPREASALLNRRKQTHFLSSKLHKSHSPQQSFFFSFVFFKIDFKRRNHWHCPRNLTSWKAQKLNKNNKYYFT